MAGRRVGVALLEILARIPRGEGRRLTLETLRDELRAGGERSPWTSIAHLFAADVDDLTLDEFRRVVASITTYLLDEPAIPESMRVLVERYATVQNVVRTLTDRETLARMARMEPVSMPDRPPSDLDRIGQLIRTGHHEGSRHWELPVSSRLYGSRMVSYFYVSGAELPAPEKRAEYLVAHDSDELAVYLGFADRSRKAENGWLPIYVDGALDPFEFVAQRPIEIGVGEFFVYDATSPHFWFAPLDTVAFFVGVSSNQMYRKPVAFRSETRDSVPGGSYGLYETRRRRRAKHADAAQPMPRPAKTDPERTSYLLGKRLRRRRDGFGLSANDIQKLRTHGRRLTANIVGKLENDAMSKAHVQLVSEFAEALDLPLADLFPRQPAKMSAKPLTEMRGPENEHNLLEQRAAGIQERPFAVVPHLIHPAAATENMRFWIGEADVVLLPMRGAVDVYVAPDPLLLALELVHDFMQHEPDRDARGFKYDDNGLVLSHETMERLKRRHLLWHDRIEERQAYHFNAALPHSVFSAPGNESLMVAVTTRPDIHLPTYWHRPSGLASGLQAAHRTPAG